MVSGKVEPASAQRAELVALQKALAVAPGKPIPPELKERPDLTREEYLLLKVLKRNWQEPRKGDTWYHLSQWAKVAKSADMKGSSKESATSETPNTQQVKC
ncbi:hypothetical protein D4764_11G0004140 [Takifugu flavidus]|uniref:Uncharacterized protein n=1 Tax=Takifugu flavidus TaxID=433684 RepID=A0A5C6PFH5_9TELE|nr:hypothetical protein D4764_11G0004140 [Takifugu flavidus]